MYIVNSTSAKPYKRQQELEKLLNSLDREYLLEVVNKISIPRHYFAESENNNKVASYLFKEFLDFNLKVIRQGKYDNILACPKDGFENCEILIGAHFDSVPNSPGADDNGSAVAGMMLSAKILSGRTNKVAFIAFNREEDGLLGSQDFVKKYLSITPNKIRFVHILEMIGYASNIKGSQKSPPGIPIKISDVGDFLAILCNRDSNYQASNIAKLANTYVSSLPVKLLKVFAGIEKFIPHLLRSDHSPFWDERIPTMMWTDTSEFRNPNYHLPSDVPESLDYDFLLKVVQLLILHCISLDSE